MEFLHLMDKRMKGIDTEEEIRDMFKVFDVDGNGFISSEEFKWTMMNLGQQLTEEEVEEILKAADLNGDGQIDLEGNKPQKNQGMIEWNGDKFAQCFLNVGPRQDFRWHLRANLTVKFSPQIRVRIDLVTFNIVVQNSTSLILEFFLYNSAVLKYITNLMKS